MGCNDGFGAELYPASPKCRRRRGKTYDRVLPASSPVSCPSQGPVVLSVEEFSC